MRRLPFLAWTLSLAFGVLLVGAAYLLGLWSLGETPVQHLLALALAAGAVLALAASAYVGLFLSLLAAGGLSVYLILRDPAPLKRPA